MAGLQRVDEVAPAGEGVHPGSEDDICGVEAEHGVQQGARQTCPQRAVTRRVGLRRGQAGSVGPQHHAPCRLDLRHHRQVRLGQSRRVQNLEWKVP